MIRLRIRQIAEAKGFSLATFQREAKLPVTNARRLWFSTSDGLADGPPLKSAAFDQLEDVARFLGVGFSDLFEQLPDE